MASHVPLRWGGAGSCICTSTSAANNPVFPACFRGDLVVCLGRRFMQALHEDAEADGAHIMFKSRVLGADVTGGSLGGCNTWHLSVCCAAPHSHGIMCCLAQCRPKEGSVR